MPASRLNYRRNPGCRVRTESAVKGNRCTKHILLCALAVSSTVAWGAETSYTAGAGINYKYDDNINLAPTNQVSLEGWILDAFIKGQYSTGRFVANGYINIDFERYTHSSINTDNPLIADPDPENFNSDNQDLRGDIAYLWERNKFTFGARYNRDSTLNTQFLDTGLGNELAIEGATRVTRATVKPGWQWQMTERQTIDASLLWEKVDYQSPRYIDYDFATANINWSYLLTERMRLQLQPYYSWFQNEANIQVQSDTYGVQAGFLWALSEKWQFDLLAGGAQVYTEYGQGGFITIDPDTGEAIVIQDQDSSSFVGNSTLSFTEEKYGFIGNVSASVSPSGNGVLQQRNQARLTYFWTPVERMRFDIDGLIGQNSSTDDRIDNDRDYRQAGIRFAYQFMQEWWLSARYRYREQERNRNADDLGSGNSVFLTLSYRLPKEIF